MTPRVPEVAHGLPAWIQASRATRDAFQGRSAACCRQDRTLAPCRSPKSPPWAR